MKTSTTMLDDKKNTRQATHDGIGSLVFVPNDPEIGISSNRENINKPTFIYKYIGYSKSFKLTQITQIFVIPCYPEISKDESQM